MNATKSKLLLKEKVEAFLYLSVVIDYSEYVKEVENSDTRRKIWKWNKYILKKKVELWMLLKGCRGEC